MKHSVSCLIMSFTRKDPVGICDYSMLSPVSNCLSVLFVSFLLLGALALDTVVACDVVCFSSR